MSSRTSPRSVFLPAILARMLACILACILVCILVCMLLALPSSAAAGAPDDLGGVGARASAMGGAGTALVRDFSAAYYNLANTTRCPDNQLAFDLRASHFAPVLESDSLELADDALEVEGPETTLRAGFGFCLPLPYKFAAGMWMAFGMPSPLRIGLGTADPTPRFPLYGQEREQLSILAGVAYRPIHALAIGVGANVLVNTTAAIAADVATSADGSIDVDADALVDVSPRVGVVVGIDVEPVTGLHFGLTYRQALFHDLYAEADIEVVGVEALACLAAQGWFSPHQVALGASWDGHPNLTLAADLTWYDWSRNPTSFLDVWVPREGSCSEPSEILYANSRPEDVGYRDVWQPRVGAEYRFERGVSLRGGYSFRPSMIEARPNTDQRSTLLDTNTHTLTGGIGYEHDLGGGTYLSLDVHGRGSIGVEDARVTLLDGADGSHTSARLSFRSAYYEAGFTSSLRWE